MLSTPNQLLLPSQNRSIASQIIITNCGGLVQDDILFQNECNSSLQKKPLKDEERKIELEYENHFNDFLDDVAKFSIESISKERLLYHNVKVIHKNDGHMRMLVRNSGVYIQFKEEKMNGTQCTYDVIIGRFYMTLKVLHLHKLSGNQNHEKSPHKIGKGSFGYVRKVSFQGHEIAVKNIKFQKNENDQNFVDQTDLSQRSKIELAIREYCIYKICSMLEVGPKVIFKDIYDIICYNDCVQFYMELCETAQDCKATSYEKDLKISLRKLHSLNFVHKDIKPENVVFSQCLQKYVFIDFGVTHVVEQNVWQKTLTYPQGTPDYFNDEMKEVFYVYQTQRKKSKANLYLYDVFALQKTIKKLDEIHENESQDFYTSNFSQNYSDYDDEYYSDCEETNDNSDIFCENQLQKSSSVNFYEMKAIFQILNRLPDDQAKIQEIVSKICQNEQDEQVTKNVLQSVCKTLTTNKEDILVKTRNSIRIYGQYSNEVGMHLEDLNSYLKGEGKAISEEDMIKFKQKINLEEEKKTKQTLQYLKYLISNNVQLKNYRSLSSVLKNMFIKFSKMTKFQDKDQLEKLILDLYLYVHATRDGQFSHYNFFQQIEKILKINKFQTKKQIRIIDSIYKRMIERKWLSSQSLLNIARNYINLMHHSAALEILNKLEEKEKSQTRSEKQLFQFNLLMCEIYTFLLQYEKAQLKIKECLVSYHESEIVKNSGNYFHVRNDLVFILIERDKLEEAEKSNEQLFQQKVQAFFPQIVGVQFARYFSFKGLIKLKRNLFEEAIESFEKSLQIVGDKNQNCQFIYETLNFLSICHSSLSNHQKTLKYIKKMVKNRRRFSGNQIEGLVYSLNLQFLHELSFGKLVKRDIEKYVKELAHLKLKGIRQRFQVNINKIQYCPLFSCNQWQLEIKNNFSVIQAKIIVISCIQPHLPFFKRQYLNTCKEIIADYIVYYPSEVSERKIIPYEWKMYLANPKSNLPKDDYKDLLIFLKKLIKFGLFKRAAYLIRLYLFAVPFLIIKKKLLRLLWKLLPNIDIPDSNFIKLIYNQKALESEGYEECCQTVSRTKCRAKQLIMKKKLKKIQPTSVIMSRPTKIEDPAFRSEREKINEDKIREKLRKKGKILIL